ncbi:MAG TPA: c-type cytochrome [Steroidobacteraceae bacterium]|nr:c-type cytochrome [Steroidobacteraceae bacterium]
MNARLTGTMVIGLAWGIAAYGQAPPAGDPVRGAEVFKVQCAACHLAKQGQPPPIGPQLYGVLGRKAGSWDGFPYTDSMRKANITWTRALLDQYLENPYSLVPGAAMGLLVPLELNRSDVIAYLASQPEALKQPERAH